jgi:beta-glucanase (GH16 family)
VRDGKREVTLTIDLWNTGLNEDNPFYGGFQRWWTGLFLPSGSTVVAADHPSLPDPDSPNGGSYALDLFPQQHQTLTVTFAMPASDTLLLRRQPGLDLLRVTMSDGACANPFSAWLDQDLTLDLTNVCTGALAQTVAGTQPDVAVQTTLSLPWQLTFGDEFDGSTLDTGKWKTHYPPGTPGVSDDGRSHPGAKTLQYFTDDAVEQNDGILHLRSERKDAGGFSYASGAISSYQSFSASEGFFEIRARVPKGAGLWPGVFLLPQDRTWPPGITLMQVFGIDLTHVSMGNSYQQSDQVQSDQAYVAGPDLSDGFHTFGLEWNSTNLIWYVDGVERYRVSANIPSKAMYLVVALEIGGSGYGPADASTPPMASFDIDYIRVYQR